VPNTNGSPGGSTSAATKLPDSVPADVEPVRGSLIYLRELEKEDVGEPYHGWMNDPEVVQYTESRFRSHSIDDLMDYVQQMTSDPSISMLAICRNDNNVHVGNIKLGPIDWHHRFGDTGLIIGDRGSWGKGYATDAISAICRYAFDVLKLHKLTASMYETNIGSYKAFLKAGFELEGKRSSQYLCEGDYTDMILMGRLRGKSEQ
jgi:ribosomal-protein-alanine N-acetyltransferase